MLWAIVCLQDPENMGEYGVFAGWELGRRFLRSEGGTVTVIYPIVFSTT
jgi:hypothetical protein